jgi:hypothetical protein
MSGCSLGFSTVRTCLPFICPPPPCRDCDLTRLRASVMAQIGNGKRRIVSILNRTFPEFTDCFTDVCGQAARTVSENHERCHRRSRSFSPCQLSFVFARARMPLEVLDSSLRHAWTIAYALRRYGDLVHPGAVRHGYLKEHRCLFGCRGERREVKGIAFCT